MNIVNINCIYSITIITYPSKINTHIAQYAV